MYKGRISIPFLTPSGPVNLGFRKTPGMESDKKYLNIAGVERKKIFNTRALFTSGDIYICEGEIDTMTCWDLGIPAVGIAGVSNWKREWWRIFRNRTVIVLADNDDAGQGSKMAEEITRDLERVVTILMPTGHDVNSLVVKEGPGALYELIGWGSND